MSVAAWAVHCLYHWDVLLPLSVLWGHNINYMLTPPPVLYRACHTLYHVAQAVVCLALTLCARMGALEIALGVSGVLGGVDG